MHIWHTIAAAWRDLVHVFAGLGPVVLLALAVLDSAGIPIVAGVDLLLVSFAAQRPSEAWFAATCAIAGSIVGSAFLFAIARKGGEVFLAKHISRGTGKRLHAWFEEYGLVTVFIPALSPLPLPLKVPIFCAGALEVRWESFLFVVLAARAIRYFALAALGREYGTRTFAFLKAHALVVALIALALGICAIVTLHFIERAGRSHTRQAASSREQ